MTANAIINNIGHNPTFVWKIPKMVSQMEKECLQRKSEGKNELLLVHPIGLALDKLVDGRSFFIL